MRYMRIALVIAVAFGTAAFGLTDLSSAAPQQEITGTYAMWHRDDFAHGRALHEFMLDTGKQLVKVDLDDSRVLGKKLRLRGNLTYENGVTAFETTSAEPVAAAATTSVTPGVKKIAVVLLNFTNDRTQPWTPTQVHGVVFDNADSTNAYYQAASNGAVSLTGDVLGFYPISLDNSGCNVSGWRNAANTAVTAAGVNLADYANVAYVWPYASSCAWSGMAGMPGNNLFINGSMMAGTFSHELGHNFGVAHAQALSCTSGTTKVALSDSCTTSEYGDPFDNMGGGYNAMLSNWHLAELGWLNDTQTITASGTYTIAPLKNATGPCLLRVARPGGNYLNLEFRQPKPPFQNYTSSYPVTNGVTIRVAPDPNGAIAPTKLVDTTPDTATWWDSPLGVGQTFNDQYGTSASKVQITTLSVSSAGATVQVTFPAGSTSTPTTTTTLPPTTTTTLPPTTTTTKPPTTTTTTLPPTTTTTTTSTSTTTLPPTTTTTQPPSGAVGPPGYVKTVATGTKSQSGNTTLTLAVPAGGGAVVGHRVIVSAAVGTFGGTVSCRDSRGNTYTIDARLSTNNLFVCSAHVTTALQAGDTITLTYPGFSGVSLASAYEFSGIAAVSPVDGAFRQGASTSTKIVSVNPALGTANANDVLFGAAGSNGTFAVSNSFVSAGASGGMAAAYRTVSATGLYGAFGTVASGSWRALLVAYRTG